MTVGALPLLNSDVNNLTTALNRISHLIQINYDSLDENIIFLCIDTNVGVIYLFMLGIRIIMYLIIM